VPIWQPSDANDWAGLEKCSLGVCLQVYTTGGWELTEQSSITQPPPDHPFNKSRSCTVLATGAVPVSEVSEWFTLTLNFTDFHVTGYINSRAVIVTSVLLPSGVVGIGSGWHPAYFDDFTVAASRPRTSGSWSVTSSAEPCHSVFCRVSRTGRPRLALNRPKCRSSLTPRLPLLRLLDILPGQSLKTDFTGLAGLLLDLCNATEPLVRGRHRITARVIGAYSSLVQQKLGISRFILTPLPPPPPCFPRGEDLP